MFPSPSNRSIRYSDIDDIPVLKNCFRLLQIGVLGIQILKDPLYYQRYVSVSFKSEY